MEIILIILGFAVVTGIAAGTKNRSFFGWFVLGLLFSVFALIAVLVMPALPLAGTPNKPNGPAPAPTPATPQPSQPAATGDLPVLLRGDGEFDQAVAGTSRRQSDLEAIAQHKRPRLYAILRPEPHNLHDPSAVAVDIEGRHIGYLPRDDAEEFSADARQLGIGSGGAKVPAKLVGGYDESPTIGVRLDLIWPLERR